MAEVDDLEDKTITVWSKENVAPAVPVNAPQIPPAWQGLMWGIFPMGSSLLALVLVLVLPERRDPWQERTVPADGQENLVMERVS